MNKDYNYDVVLIVPPFLEVSKREQENKYENLAVGYLLASLPQNAKGLFVDGLNYDYSQEDIIQIVRKYNPKIIGLSCNFSVSVETTILYAELIKEYFPDIHITCGGHGIVPYKDEIINLGIVDSICLCEGENCFPEFVDKYLVQSNYQDTKGMWFNINGNIFKNENLPLIGNLDEIKWPIRRDGITGTTITESFENGTFTLISSRGCPFTCKFCDIKTFYGNGHGKSWRMRSAEDIINEIEYLIKEHGAQTILIGDDNFIGSTKRGFDRIDEFCNLINERNIKINFGIEARVTDINLEVMTKLKDAGLISVMLGVENGSQAVLNRWNKNILVEDSIEAIDILERLNLNYFINFIMYDMNSTLEDIEENLNFLKTTGIFRDVYPIHLFDNKLGLFLGAEITEEVKKTDLVSKTLKNVGHKGFELVNYSYDFEDIRMRYLDKLQYYWVNKIRYIRKQMNDVDRQQFDRQSGLLLLQNFEICLKYAKMCENYIEENNVKSLLNNKISFYLRRVGLSQYSILLAEVE